MSSNRESPWAGLGRVLSRRTVATLVVVVIVTAAMPVGVQQLDFATGQDS